MSLWFWVLTSFLCGVIMSIITLGIVSKKLLHRGKSGINSIMEYDENVIPVLNPKNGVDYVTTQKS